jgi:hypothetical protein
MQVFGLANRCLEAFLRGVGGDVEQRTGECGDRDPTPRRDFPIGEMRAVPPYLCRGAAFA